MSGLSPQLYRGNYWNASSMEKKMGRPFQRNNSNNKKKKNVEEMLFDDGGWKASSGGVVS